MEDDPGAHAGEPVADRREAGRSPYAQLRGAAHARSPARERAEPPRRAAISSIRSGASSRVDLGGASSPPSTPERPDRLAAARGDVAPLDLGAHPLEHVEEARCAAGDSASSRSARRASRARAAAAAATNAAADGSAGHVDRRRAQRCGPRRHVVRPAALDGDPRTRAASSSVWARVGAARVTASSPSAPSAASRTADFTCAEATASAPDERLQRRVALTRSGRCSGSSPSKIVPHRRERPRRRAPSGGRAGSRRR
jgi:hypothetical protein